MIFTCNNASDTRCRINSFLCEMNSHLYFCVIIVFFFKKKIILPLIFANLIHAFLGERAIFNATHMKKLLLLSTNKEKWPKYLIAFSPSMQLSFFLFFSCLPIPLLLLLYTCTTTASERKREDMFYRQISSIFFSTTITIIILGVCSGHLKAKKSARERIQQYSYSFLFFLLCFPSNVLLFSLSQKYTLHCVVFEERQSRDG